MSGGRLIFDQISGKNQRDGSLTGMSPVLVLCLGGVLFANQAALANGKQEQTIALAAYEACVPADAAAVRVEGDGRGVFVSSAGERYFASDLHRPDDRSVSHSSNRGEEASGAGWVEAVSAGVENRWGLTPAWIVLHGEGGIQLLQAERLLRGEALFAPDRAEGGCADILRQAEARARAENAGLWEDKGAAPIYSTGRPESLTEMTGHYVIARGRIVSLGKTERTRYLNFGHYWKTDFTVTLGASDEERLDAALARSGWHVEELAGKTVELRGVVQERDGPHIALHHPEQLVVLEDKRAARGGQYSN